MKEDFSNSLLSEAELLKLSEKSDMRGFLKLAQHFGALIVTGFGLLVIENSMLFCALFAFHGLLLAFLFCPLHLTSLKIKSETKSYNFVEFFLYQDCSKHFHC